jgi:hypothetical protein
VKAEAVGLLAPPIEERIAALEKMSLLPGETGLLIKGSGVILNQLLANLADVNCMSTFEFPGAPQEFVGTEKTSI